MAAVGSLAPLLLARLHSRFAWEVVGSHNWFFVTSSSCYCMPCFYQLTARYVTSNFACSFKQIRAATVLALRHTWRSSLHYTYRFIKLACAWALWKCNALVEGSSCSSRNIKPSHASYCRVFRHFRRWSTFQCITVVTLNTCCACNACVIMVALGAKDGDQVRVTRICTCQRGATPRTGWQTKKKEACNLAFEHNA